MTQELTAHVALLRGINVGGHNRLPMADLRAVASDLGWQGARTYLASGNLVFRARDQAPGALAEALRGALAARGLPDVPTRIVTRAEMARAMEGCPFDPEDDTRVHVGFCWADAAPDLEALPRFATQGEGLEVRGRLFWLHTPLGMGRSKLAASLDRVLGVAHTARNLRTIRALNAMLDETGAA